MIDPERTYNELRIALQKLLERATPDELAAIKSAIDKRSGVAVECIADIVVQLVS